MKKDRCHRTFRGPTLGLGAYDKWMTVNTWLVVVGGWWWLRPILVFSLSLDQAEQKYSLLTRNILDKLHCSTTTELMINVMILMILPPPRMMMMILAMYPRQRTDN